MQPQSPKCFRHESKPLDKRCLGIKYSHNFNILPTDYLLFTNGKMYLNWSKLASLVMVQTVHSKKYTTWTEIFLPKIFNLNQIKPFQFSGNTKNRKIQNVWHSVRQLAWPFKKKSMSWEKEVEVLLYIKKLMKYKQMQCVNFRSTFEKDNYKIIFAWNLNMK